MCPQVFRDCRAEFAIVALDADQPGHFLFSIVVLTFVPWSVCGIMLSNCMCTWFADRGLNYTWRLCFVLYSVWCCKLGVAYWFGMMFSLFPGSPVLVFPCADSPLYGINGICLMYATQCSVFRVSDFCIHGWCIAIVSTSSDVGCCFL